MSLQIGLAQLQLDNDAIIRVTDAALEYQSRSNRKDARIDLWGRNKAQLPESAIPAIVHEVFCAIEWFDQVIWFNRTEERDELWAFTDMCTNIESRLRTRRSIDRAKELLVFGQDAACTLSVPRSGSFDEALLGLLGVFFSTSAGAVAGMERIIATAYINQAHVRLILGCIERHRARERIEREEYARQARKNETEIIQVACELRLDPEPAGTGPVLWRARCPAKRLHPLMITTGEDRFGCGYCRVNGGVAELRAFVAEGGRS